VQRRENMMDVFFFMYENKTMKLVEIALSAGGEMRENMEELNLIKICCKHIYVNVIRYPSCTTIIC
jgi:hypothetical protein